MSVVSERCVSEAIMSCFYIPPACGAERSTNTAVRVLHPIASLRAAGEMRLQLPAAVTALVASATDKMWEANVRATGKDQLRLNEDVEIRPSFGKGMGVFALRCACTNP